MELSEGRRPPGRLVRVVCLVFASLFLFSCVKGPVVRVSDNSVVAVEDLTERLSRARLVFVGEEHDNKWHHQVQLQVIRLLHEQDVDLAVGLEMFRAEEQGVLDRWTSGQMSARSFIREYYRNWTAPWPLYRDIFLYAREHGIPLVGLNVPQSLIHQVFNKGFESLTSEQLEQLPGARCEVDETYEEFIRRAMGGHDMKGATFKNFCEAQMVWDTTMAHSAVEYLKEHPARTMVVLAGSGHAWKRGIPNQVKRLSDFSYLVILPESEGKVTRGLISTGDADYIWLKQ